MTPFYARSFRSLALILALTYAAVAQDAPLPHELPRTEVVLYGDIVDVDVVGGFEFDWRGSLTPEGYLDGFQTYGAPIYALCRTEADIAADAAKALSKILRDPKVVVRVVDRSGRALARVDGAVKTPTRFRLNRPAHLRELLVMAGGLTDDSSGTITIFSSRGASCKNIDAKQLPGSEDNLLKTQNIKIIDLLRGKSEADVEISPGDIVTVERALPIYTIGAVVNPGPISSRVPLTVTRAIATAGGLQKTADAAQVTIFRREGSETKVIDVDLTKIKTGDPGDELLKPFDIIDVASRGGTRRKLPPVALTDGGPKRELPLKVVD